MKRLKICFFSLIFVLCATLDLKAQYIDFTEAAEKALKSSVYVECLKNNKFSNLFKSEKTQKKVTSFGSGVIIKEDGYIVTNCHVIKDSTKEIKVTLYDNRSFKARFIGTDKELDLTVLKIEADSLTPIKFGNSNKIKVGEWVLAIGNPYQKKFTATAGIISGISRNIKNFNLLGVPYLDCLIQHDAMVNPGNSGGALVNPKGELMGINSAKSYNYSYAIPSNIVKKAVNDIIKYGKIQKVSLGIVFSKTNTQKGFYVKEVKSNSIAEKAEIKTGDIILKINDKETNTTKELREILYQLSRGEKITLLIEREGNVLEKIINC